MTPEELKLLIAEGEGLSVEFKEKYTPKIDRDLVAFANTTGGRILLGVRDDGTVMGEKLTNRLKAEIQALSRQCDPPLDIHHLNQIGDVVVIDVLPGEEKPYSCASGYFRRMDAVTQKMNRKELSLHFQASGKNSFEDRFDADVSWKQISSKKVSAFFQEADIRQSGARPPPSWPVSTWRMEIKSEMAGFFFLVAIPNACFPNARRHLWFLRGTREMTSLIAKTSRTICSRNLTRRFFFFKST
jgi:predicted HTH transcriptional regulator